MASLADRFQRATRDHLLGPLRDDLDIVIRPATKARWTKASDELMRGAFDRHRLDLRAAYAKDELARMRAFDAALKEAPLEHRVLLWRGKEIVGAYWGQQDERGSYYMVFSVIRRDRHGQGLYSALLGKVLATARAAGFLDVWSRHHTDNNAILVPKMKRGFVITGFEIVPRYGLLVSLRYFMNDTVREIYRYRVDATMNGAALRKKKLLRDD
jgi:GNAT superfamily N-acetyltransferase